MVDDGTLREAFAAAEPAAPHVGEDTWERFACGELGAEERERVVDHAARCSSCGRILRALVLLEGEAREFDPLVPEGFSSPSEARKGRPYRWGALAGVAAAAAAVMVWLAVPSFRQPFSGSSAPEADPLRSAPESDRPLPKSPTDEVFGKPDGFTWQGTKSARAYRVELFDSEAEPIWRSEDVSETTVPWPEEVRPEPGRYYWRVIAILTDRAETIASPLVDFDVKP